MSSEPPYTSAEFHNQVHKQIVATAVAALEETKLPWAQVAPFLEAGRSMCRDDLRLNGRFALHGLEQQGEELAEAEEAYLSISVRDREDGTEWLSQSYWLSDIVLTDQDPERVRSAIAGIERSLTRLRQWLTERETAIAAQPPATDAEPDPAAAQPPAPPVP
jgi:hypothetical protein